MAKEGDFEAGFGGCGEIACRVLNLSLEYDVFCGGLILQGKIITRLRFLGRKNKPGGLFFFSRNLGGSRGIRTPDFLGVNETL